MNVAKTETLVCKKGGRGVLKVGDINGEEIRQVRVQISRYNAM